MKLITIILIFMILLPASLVSAQEEETETQADAGSTAHGTVSAGAGVSVSSDETVASASAHADSSSRIASSIADVVASGRKVESYSFSISDHTGSIAGSAGIAVGNLISLFSRSTATGRNVYGEGEAAVTASQSASAGVMTEVIPLENGLYQITVQASGDGAGDASGTVYTIAWALDQPLAPIQVQPVVVQQRSFTGFTFGHGDTERYLHFRNQIATSSNPVITDRAKYWLETIAWADYGLTQQEFEDKYINNSFYRNFTIQQYLKLKAKSD